MWKSAITARSGFGNIGATSGRSGCVSKTISSRGGSSTQHAGRNDSSLPRRRARSSSCMEPAGPGRGKNTEPAAPREGLLPREAGEPAPPREAGEPVAPREAGEPASDVEGGRMYTNFMSGSAFEGAATSRPLFITWTWSCASSRTGIQASNTSCPAWNGSVLIVTWPKGLPSPGEVSTCNAIRIISPGENDRFIVLFGTLVPGSPIAPVL